MACLVPCWSVAANIVMKFSNFYISPVSRIAFKTKLTSFLASLKSENSALREDIKELEERHCKTLEDNKELEERHCSLEAALRRQSLGRSLILVTGSLTDSASTASSGFVSAASGAALELPEWSGPGASPRKIFVKIRVEMC